MTQFQSEQQAVINELPTSLAADSNELFTYHLKDIMERPFPVFTGNWTTSQVANTNLTVSSGIFRLIPFNAIWADKVKGYNLMRGTVCLRLVINPNPFQQGKLRLSLEPCAINSITRNYSISSNSMLPSVLLDARMGSATLKVPYVSPYHWYDVKKDAFDLGFYNIKVESPLTTGAAGDTTVSYTLYMWFEDFELSAPLVPQMGDRRKPRKVVISSEHRAKEAEGATSKIFHNVANLADSLSVIPIIKPIAQTVSWVTNLIGDGLSLFGFSKPLFNTPPQILATQRIPFSGNSDGISLAVPYSLMSQNSIALSDRYTPNECDEMNFSFIKSVPMYVGSFSWSNSQVSGTNLYTIDLAPFNFKTNCDGGTYGSRKISGDLYAPFAHITRLFEYYRGSIILTFRFTKTDFHSGRLAFVYTPSIDGTTLPTVPTSASYSIREMVDIKDHLEVSLKLPYMCRTPWLPTSNKMGFLNVLVQNRLIAPETVSASISTLVYASAADDYDVAGPLGSTNPGITFVPQMGDSTKSISKVIGTTSDSAYPLSIEPCTLSMGEKFTSVLQLLKRYTPFSFTSGSVAAPGPAYTINPFSTDQYASFPASPFILRPRAVNFFHQYIQSGYTFHRGGFRVAFVDNTASASLGTIVAATNAPSPFLASAPSAITGVSIPTALTSYPANNVGAAQIFDGGTAIYETTIPYYSETDCTYIDYNRNSTNNQPISPPTGVAINDLGSAISLLPTYTAVAEDYQLCYFVGFRPIITAMV